MSIKVLSEIYVPYADIHFNIYFYF